MKLKIPPVALVMITAAMMWGMDKVIHLSYSFSGKEWVIKSIFLLCVIVLVFALVAFWKLKTTVDPTNPEKATKLVTIGIYHVSRNPMYLAMLLLLIGFGFKLGNPLNLLSIAFFIWYMNQFQIKPEEQALTKLFGQVYLDYCKKVRRWI